MAQPPEPVTEVVGAEAVSEQVGAPYCLDAAAVWAEAAIEDPFCWSVHVFLVDIPR